MGLVYIKYNSDKFQRLGLLKILVAILDPQRRSQASENIIRKLEKLLVGADELVKSSNNNSWNYRFSKARYYEIIDWGKLYGFIGSGNQITEKGLILRYLMGADIISSITSGKFNINPFDLTNKEKLYFLYNHFEIDSPLVFLVKRLSSFSENDSIRARDANKLICQSMYDVYEIIKNTSFSRQIRIVQGMRNLIGKMVFEQDLFSEIPISRVNNPKPGSIIKNTSSRSKIKRTKTSDAEAITRFEFLTDLNLFDKKPKNKNDIDIEKYRKSWLYWITSNLVHLSKRLKEFPENDFYLDHFSYIAAPAIWDNYEDLKKGNDEYEIFKIVFDSYQGIKRIFGHTPLETVGIVTMINALTDKKIIEVRDVHNLFLKIKKENILSDSVRFAAGNELNKMFIDIKPNFINEIEIYYGK